jgi:ABC-type nitrate/sulfonate/bicarbonate transport system permease component
MSIVLIGLVALAIFYYFQELIIFLASADGDLVRLKLMYNGFLATLHSPFIGLGVGSFSGLEYAFQGSEAHNTFLDLSMQFGIIVPIILYFVIFAALFKSIKNRDNLLATIIVAFFICSLFNFYARHFVFWLVIGFLYYYYYTGFKPQK